jgi:hypothetical protein
VMNRSVDTHGRPLGATLYEPPLTPPFQAFHSSWCMPTWRSARSAGLQDRNRTPPNRLEIHWRSVNSASRTRMTPPDVAALQADLRQSRLPSINLHRKNRKDSVVPELLTAQPTRISHRW